MPDPPGRPEPPPEGRPPPGPAEGDTLYYGLFDDEPLDAIDELQERLARKETELDQTRGQLQEERKERDDERADILRWMVTQTFSTFLGIAIVIIAVLGAIFYQVFSVNSELRDKGERLAVLEYRLGPTSVRGSADSISDSSSQEKGDTSAKEKNDTRPPWARK